MAALQRLSGKVAVVTGATSGIGLAIAQRFVDEGWKLVNDRLDKVFASYSDRELHREVATHRNRGYYLLGHLTVAHDRLLPLLRLGDRLHPELEEEFFANPDRAFPDPVVWPAQLREAWSQVNKQLQAGIETLTVDQWLERHASISPEEFVKEPLRNRLSVLLTGLGHATLHEGQIQPAR